MSPGNKKRLPNTIWEPSQGGGAEGHSETRRQNMTREKSKDLKEVANLSDVLKEETESARFLRELLPSDVVQKDFLQLRGARGAGNPSSPLPCV